MDKKNKIKLTSNIPKSDLGVKKSNEFAKLIPFHIPSPRQNFNIPDQNKISTIYINDLETLNDSSFTNNLDCLSNKDQQSLGDSLSLAHSRQGSKKSLFEEKTKKINSQMIQEELVKTEKENILLKKEINDLQKYINLIKDKESTYQKNILKLKDEYQELEKTISIIKKENILKEKELLDKINQIQKVNKAKDETINSFQEKIIYKNKIIQNLNNIIKTKDLKISELNNRIKHSNKYHKKNIVNNNKNLSYLNSDKENENHNSIKSNNLKKDNQKNMNLKQFIKNYKLIINKEKTKIKTINQNNEDKSMNSNIKSSKIHHKGSYRDQGPPKQIKIYGYIDESKTNFHKNIINDMSLKKPLYLSNKLSLKIIKTRSKKYENNSMKNLFNIKLDRNSLRQFSNISSFSYSNKNNERYPSKENKNYKEISNLSQNNLIKEENPKEVFLKRLYKVNQKIIRTSISDSSNSYLYSDNENNKNNYKKFDNSNIKSDNKSYELNLYESSKRKKNYSYNTKKGNYIKKCNNKIINQKSKINKSKKIKESIDKTKILNSYKNNSNETLNFNFGSIEKNNSFIQSKYKYKKPNVNYTNINNDLNSNNCKANNKN